MELSVTDLAEQIADAMKNDNPNKEWEEYAPIKKSEDGKLMEVYLAEAVHLPPIYNRFCHELRHMPEDGEVIIYINNGGGVEQTAVAIMDAIKACKAEVTAHLSGMVASAATLIAMACDNIIVSNHLMFMVHESAFDGLGGKFSDMKTFNAFFDDYTKQMSYDVYGGFLTNEEIEYMHNGKEFWFGSEEVLERWKNKELLAKGD